MTTTHKFRDCITRPAHQHNNGGGWVAENAYAADEAYIGPRAEVIGGTILGGTIEGGDVTRDVTFICGCIPYQVTITDTHAGVGCQWKTHDEWETDGAKIATDNNMTTADYELLMMFIRRHQQGAKT